MTSESADPLQPSPDCCGVWPKIVHHFFWYHLSESPETQLMPCLIDPDADWRINFCPSCGAPRRDVIRNAPNP